MTKAREDNDLMITANRLADGAVIWLADDFTWSPHRRDAGYFNVERVQAARASAADDDAGNLVTAIYEIVVDGKQDVSARENIRANQGPTIVPPMDQPEMGG
jgi:hypothetical protein